MALCWRGNALTRRRCRLRADLIPQYPTNATDTGNIELVTDIVGQQPFPDFPRENARVLIFDLAYKVDDLWGGHSGLAAADGPRHY